MQERRVAGPPAYETLLLWHPSNRFGAGKAVAGVYNITVRLSGGLLQEKSKLVYVVAEPVVHSRDHGQCTLSKTVSPELPPRTAKKVQVTTGFAQTIDRPALAQTHLCRGSSSALESWTFLRRPSRAVQSGGGYPAILFVRRVLRLLIALTHTQNPSPYYPVSHHTTPPRLSPPLHHT